MIEIHRKVMYTMATTYIRTVSRYVCTYVSQLHSFC